MRWFRSGLQSLSGWLTAPAVGARAASGQQMEAIRDAMLAALGEAGAARRHQPADRWRRH